MARIKDQPPSRPNNTKPIWDLVIEDMRERDRVGRERYGTPLQVDNGRDHLVDAYQETLDQAVYLRQEIEARKLPAAGPWRYPSQGEMPEEGKRFIYQVAGDYYVGKVDGRYFRGADGDAHPTHWVTRWAYINQEEA